MHIFNPFKFFYHCCREAVKRFYSENYTYRASALTYTTLLAIVPLLSVIVYLITLFPIFNHIVSLSENYILNNFVPASAASIESYFHSFINKASHLHFISIFFLLISAILLINTIEETLDETWRVQARRKRVRSLILCWLILVFTPIILGVSVGLTTYFSSLSWVVNVTKYLGLTEVLILGSSISVNLILFSLLYKIVPNAHVRWRECLLGGFFAAILFESARLLFTLYVKEFPSYESIYGAFAVFPIFLIWLFISWCIILFGALFTYEHSKFREVKTDVAHHHQVK